MRFEAVCRVANTEAPWAKGRRRKRFSHQQLQHCSWGEIGVGKHNRTALFIAFQICMPHMLTSTLKFLKHLNMSKYIHQQAGSKPFNAVSLENSTSALLAPLSSPLSSFGDILKLSSQFWGHGVDREVLSIRPFIWQCHGNLLLMLWLLICILVSYGKTKWRFK